MPRPPQAEVASMLFVAANSMGGKGQARDQFDFSTLRAISQEGNFSGSKSVSVHYRKDSLFTFSRRRGRGTVSDLKKDLFCPERIEGRYGVKHSLSFSV